MSTDSFHGQSTGKLLVEDGLITQAQLEIAYKEQAARQGPATLSLVDILVRNRFCSREQIEKALSRKLGRDSVHLHNNLLPQAICRRYLVMPERVENGVLVLKVGAPLSEQQKKAIMNACLLPVSGLRLRAVSKLMLDREFSNKFVDNLVLSDCLEALRKNEPTGQLIRNAITALLKEALEVRASDILLDFRGDHDSWISWRVDGVLQRKFVMPRSVMGPLAIRIKTEAGMDAAETRREQDGRIHYQYGGLSMDFRVSALPIVGGEGITMRVLDGDSLPALPDMFPQQPDLVSTLKGYLQVREKRGGLIIISGQTGSGKSTTMSAMARLLPRERVNVITVEDPVEIQLPFARQFQPNALLKQTMAQTERTLLRQDPDIIIIGEIRDADSACTALKLIESGHMVLTTVHAESPLQALLRVTSLVAERESREWASFVISQFLKVSINQSLWARPCTVCSRPGEGGVWHNKAGCSHCNQGRRGRVLVHDTLLLGREVSDLERNALQDALTSGSAQDLRHVQTLAGINRLSREHVVRHLVAQKFLALDELAEFEPIPAAVPAQAQEGA